MPNLKHENTAVVRMPAVSKLQVRTKNYNPIDKFHSEIVKKVFPTASLLYGNKVKDILKFARDKKFNAARFTLRKKDYNALKKQFRIWLQKHHKDINDRQLELAMHMELLDIGPSISEDSTELKCGMVKVSWG